MNYISEEKTVKKCHWDKIRVTGPGCSLFLQPWKMDQRPSLLSLSFSVLLQTPACSRPSLAQAFASFPVSACRLLVLSEGQLSAVRPTFPLQTTIKTPLFRARGEMWEETHALYTKHTFCSVPPKHRDWALPPQISTWVLHYELGKLGNWYRVSK